MVSKQIILGSVLLIGGAVTIFAMTQNHEPASANTQPQVAEKSEVARPVAVPLTTDLATEEKILAQKQKERETYNQQMAREADQLLSEQERARMLALDKAKQEANPESAQQISADNASKSELIAVPTVQTRPEAVEAARVAEEKRLAEEKAAQERRIAEQKAKEVASKPVTVQKEPAQAQPKPAEPKPVAKSGGHTVVSGDTLIGLSQKYGVPVSTIASANNMGRDDALPLGRTIKIPTAAQAAKPAQETKAKTDKPAVQNSDKSASKTDEKKPANTGYNYSVQVAISPDKAKVDEMVKKYRAAGYKVSTSQTSRGTRVLIGSANSYDEANAIKQKLAKDSRVDASGAWVKKLEK